MKKYFITIPLILLSIVIFSLYYLGLPGKDKFAYNSKLHWLDTFSEKICLLMSSNNGSRANKLIGYLSERLDESKIGPLDQSLISSQYDSAYKTIQSISDPSLKTKLLSSLLNNSETIFYLDSMDDANDSLHLLVSKIAEDANNLPDGSPAKETVSKLNAAYMPEITTKGASLSTSTISKIPPISSVNLNFIKNKIRAINSKEPMINAVNIISDKGIIAVINMQDNTTNGDNTYNLQVFFFKNSSSGLRYIRNDYFEGETDIDDFVSSYPLFTSSLNIAFEELDWLCYYHRHAPIEGENILNYY